MGLYGDVILPRLVDRVCGRDAITVERARWVPRAKGRVLEVGVGSGLNLALYDPARVVSVVGVDPSTPLLGRARRRAARAPVAVSLALGAAEALAFDDATFDTIVLTYTLCSVGDPARALGEARRVLAPGGALVFVEHGLAPDPRVQRLQRAITPAWRRVAGNCHLDRDTLALLAAAGFAPVEHASTYSDGPRWLGYTTEGAAVVA
jgi:ubiquinone/menaquinone biosynthesis C-methylase UbiE